MSRLPLPERLAALDTVIAEGDGRLDGTALDTARRVREKAEERLARGDDAVVAALCGGTGSGKSTLFNALARADLAETGVRRPTTAEVRALAVGDPAATGAVCDWLGVGRRHHVDAAADLPDGLVLLDLPDTDSVATAHRVLAARFVERVDLLVWVADPVKYAHRALHDAYLRRLGSHADVVVVVLNRVDELSGEGRRACLDDLRRLLAEDGLERARLLATSARTGEGVDELRRLLADEARRRRAVAARIAADVRGVAVELRDALDGLAGARVDDRGLSSALAAAAGVPAIGEAAAAAYRRAARAGTRGAPARAAAAVGGRVSGPLRSARAITTGSARALATGGQAAASAAPGAHPAPLAVRRALAEVVDTAGGTRPTPGGERLRAVVAAATERLPRRLAAAVDTVRVAPPRRRWWTPVAALLSLLELVILVGVGWLAVLAVLDYLLLPAPPTPQITERLSWPTALALGGLVLRAVAGLVRRRLVAVGAGNHRRRIERRLREAVAHVAAEAVVDPVRAELEAQSRVADALDRAAR